MSDPLITPDDLATYLNDPQINVDRATALIADAQTLCEAIVSPLPATASVVVKRVAGRAYVTTTSSRSAQAAAAGSPFGTMPGGTGGVYLTRYDKRDLRLANGGGGAFTVDMLPDGYTLTVPPWDSSADYLGWQGWGTP